MSARVEISVDLLQSKAGVQGLRLPLYSALIVSPVVLFMNWSMCKAEQSQPALQLWHAMDQDPSIQKIENILWRALFDLTRGTVGTIPRLKQAFDEMGDMLTANHLIGLQTIDN